MRTGQQANPVARNSADYMAVLLLTWLYAVSPAAEELDPVPDKPEAAEIALAGIDGKRFTLSKYRGAVVLVSFWATWCPQCIWEMPALQVLSNRYPADAFTILAVNVGEEPNTVQAFANRQALKFPILLDRDLETYKKWPVLGLPTAFLIDHSGKIVYQAVGAIEWLQPEILAKIEALLAHN